jgi:DedD protein
MNYLREHDDIRQHPHEDGIASKEHELTLSTAAIFGIFFGQVVLCAIFFGFGYSMGGHRSTGTLPSESASSSSNPNFSGFKPAPGQPGPAPRAAVVTSSDAPAPTESESAETPSTAAPVESKPAESKPITSLAPAPIVRTTPAPAAEAPRPAAPVSGFLVQVAAISLNHPDDATMLQNALRAKGYAVSAHSGPDQFIHLLLGPFSDRSAAEAMRQKLLTDGYTAYIK